MNIIQKSALFLLQTPAFLISIWPAVTVSPAWILVGIAGAVLRLIYAYAVFYRHSAQQSASAAEYISVLRRENYEGNLYSIDELIPSFNQVYSPSGKIYVRVARATIGRKPLDKYYAFTMPFHDHSVIVIGDEPTNLGSVLYFQFLHEVGHAIFSGQSHTLNRVAPRLEMFVLYLPILLLFPPLPFGIAVLPIAFWHYRLERHPDFAEVSADQFAIAAFDALRGEAARKKVVASLAERWRDSDDPEHCLRAKFLDKPVGYSSSHGGVDSSNLPMGYRKSVKEVSIDKTGAMAIESVKSGPLMAIAAIALACFMPGFSFESSTEMVPSPGEALLVMVPISVALLMSAIHGRRDCVRQSANIAWILATSDWEREHASL